MIYQLYSIFDAAIGAYNTPIFTRSKGEAIRSFTEAANDEKSQLSRHATDYTLFYVGTFDDAGGVFDPCPPQRVLAALDVIHQTGAVEPASQQVSMFKR